MRAGQTNFRRPAVGLERVHRMNGDINLSKPLARQFYFQQTLFRNLGIVIVIFSGPSPPLYTQML